MGGNINRTPHKRENYYVWQNRALHCMKFGQALRLARVGAKMTQLQLSQKVGTHRCTIGQFEMGLKLPRPELFKRIASSIKGVDQALLYSLYFKDMMIKHSEDLKCCLFSPSQPEPPRP